MLCAAFLAGGTLTLAPWVSQPVGAAMELPYGGEVVYADQANGPLRVWPEVQLGNCPRLGERTAASRSLVLGRVTALGKSLQDVVTHVEVRK